MNQHRSPENVSDHVALIITKILRFFADTFFSKRYGHRAVVLETVAAVPGMVGGMWIHLTCLRKMQSDRGWIKILLDEAEHERMHLMTFIEIAQPKWYERLIILAAQAIFWNFYFLLYVFFPRTAHRLVGYFEDEAVISYTAYYDQVSADLTLNVEAPQIAKDYWNLADDAKLLDVIKVVRADEQNHADVNHGRADSLDKPDDFGKTKKEPSFTKINSVNIQSYKDANYHIYDKPLFVINVGSKCSGLNKLYDKYGVSEAAVLTAYNPMSQKTSDHDNKRNNQQLELILKDQKLPFIRAEGICPDNKWPGEESFLVLGMKLNAAKELGKKFNQNAIVWSDQSAISQLILLR